MPRRRRREAFSPTLCCYNLGFEGDCAAAAKDVFAVRFAAVRGTCRTFVESTSDLKVLQHRVQVETGVVLYLYCKEETFQQSSVSWRAVLLETGSHAV